MNRILLLGVTVALFSWPTLISASTDLFTTVVYAFIAWLAVCAAIAGLCVHRRGVCSQGESQPRPLIGNGDQ